MTCYICHKPEFTDPSGLHRIINQCQKCDKYVCEECCDCDYDLVDDPPTYHCTEWCCGGGCK